MTIIGLKGSESSRMTAWHSMLNSRKSYNTFKNRVGEEEQQIAETDKNVYDYWLSTYVA